MNLCVLCATNNTLYGLQHDNGNGLCLQCVVQIRNYYIKVLEFPYEEEQINA